MLLELGCSHEKLVSFVDADNNDGKSTPRYVYLFRNSLILWCSKKQSLVAPSSTIAKYLMHDLAMKGGLWLQQMVTALNLDHEHPILSKTDSVNALQIVTNNAYILTAKWLDIRYHFWQRI